MWTITTWDNKACVQRYNDICLFGGLLELAKINITNKSMPQFHFEEQSKITQSKQLNYALGVGVVIAIFVAAVVVVIGVVVGVGVIVAVVVVVVVNVVVVYLHIICTNSS